MVKNDEDHRCARCNAEASGRSRCNTCDDVICAYCSMEYGTCGECE